MIGETMLAQKYMIKDNVDYIPSKRDLVWLEFDPRVGHEQSGRRPALVLSEQLFAERTGLAIVCPVTSKNQRATL